jgi:fused signal recognition particle receptor
MLKRVWQKVKSLNLRDVLSNDSDRLMERLEERFVMADFGMETSVGIIEKVSARVKANDGGVERVLQEEVISILAPEGMDLSLRDPATVQGPSVVLLVGVNGTGKTTTCAKLARMYMEDGLKVLLVAADTFRAGASEQLTRWSERLGCGVLSQTKGADPASVLYDGIKAAQSRGIDVVICDTAGRLHTEKSLMEELQKVKRVSSNLIPSAPHEILLVIDATTGQNAIKQARTFHDALGLTGLVLCKLDGTSKGGIVVSVADQLKVPVKLLGVGEREGDLVPFEPRAFTSRLLGLSGDADPESTASRKHVSSP